MNGEEWLRESNKAIADLLHKLRLFKFWYGRNFYIVIGEDYFPKVYVVERRKFKDGYHYVLEPIKPTQPRHIGEIGLLLRALESEKCRKEVREE